MMKGSDRMNGLLSVIIPAYNEQEMIPKAAATIAEILEQAEISYELLFVNDGSRDLSWQCIEEAADQNPSIQRIESFEKFRQRIGDVCPVYQKQWEIVWS